MNAHDRELKRVFQKGSKNFHSSSLLFPRRLQHDITALYAFVRTADNFVDSIPQQTSNFNQFRQEYQHALQRGTSHHPIIAAFAELVRRRNFDPQWIEAFFESMYMDLHKKRYHSEQEILQYIYGSAEVIGLCILRIMNASPTLEQSACLYGRALQYINFIRDINEDNKLGRTYLPVAEYNLPNLSYESALRYPQRFQEFMRAQLARYHLWFQQGAQGLAHLAYRYRLAIGTAGCLYNWVAARISANPLIVYRRKVKPSRPLIVALALRYSIQAIGQ